MEEKIACSRVTLADLLVSKLKDNGFLPLPKTSVFLDKEAEQDDNDENKEDRVYEEEDEEEEEEEQQQQEEEDDDDECDARLKLSKTQKESIISRFPYSYSGVKHAMCFPLTFSLKPTQLRDLCALARAPMISIHLSAEKIKRAWGHLMRFKENSYHFVPLEIHTKSVDSRGIPIQLAYRLVSKTVHSNNKKTAIWTHCKTPMNDSDAIITDGLIDADVQRDDGRITWKASTQLMTKEEFHRMKILNFGDFKLDRIGALQAGPFVKVKVPKPTCQTCSFSDVLEWMLAANRSMDGVTLEPEKRNNNNNNDEDNETETLVFPKTKYELLMQALASKIDQEKNLLSIDEGLTLEIMPAEQGGWSLVQQMANQLQNVEDVSPIPNPAVTNPWVHLNITLELCAIPLVASPRDEKLVVPSGPIPVGYAGRSTKMSM